MSAIEVKSLRRHFTGADAPAVDDVSFEIEEGEMLVLLGPSGCGKTTTLRCIGGLEPPDDGEIMFGERTIYSRANKISVPTHRRRVGIVYQTFALWPHLTAALNIEFPLKAARWDRKKRAERVAEVARLVELTDEQLGRRPAQLSGGQQQRVALARAMSSRPTVMLFDEPLSNLDAMLRTQLRVELRRIHRSLGFTGVYVTHDLAEAASLGDRVAVMGAGRIAQIGRTSEVFERPSTEAVAKLLGARRLIEMHAVDGRWTARGAQPAGDLPPLTASSLTLYCQPAAMTCVPSGAALPENTVRLDGGVVTEVDFLGTEVRLWIAFGDESIVIQAPRSTTSGLSVGAHVAIDLPALEALYFSEGVLHQAGRDRVRADRAVDQHA